jgi:hypothetical protein
MRSVLGFVVVVALWAMPFAAAGQAGKPAAEAKAHQQTITVEPTSKGCSVSLSTKVGKALGTPEGLSPTTLGDTGREPLGSVIACKCGAKVESKECPQGGSCRCGPDNTPSVVCS